MTVKNKVARPNGELMRELREQVLLLQLACETFDKGVDAVGKHISLSLRVLLHHKGQSRALLEQLGQRTGRYLDTAGALNPRNMLPECNLVSLQVRPDGASYVPTGASPSGEKRAPFDKWWNDPVLKDVKGRLFNRRELVLHVADTDGGAHVDPELDEAYMDLSRANSLGWVFADSAEPVGGRAELICMRQIAYEILDTLRHRIPSLFT